MIRHLILRSFYCLCYLLDISHVSFLLSPGTTELDIVARFNPKESVIDTHGLSVKLKVEDCSAKVDIMNQLLNRMLPSISSTPSVNYVPVSPPLSATAEKPRLSRFSLTAPASAIVSPVYSFTSSLFSPSSFFSPSDANSAKPSLFSPTSAKLLSARSHLSPSSPFFRAFSVSFLMYSCLSDSCGSQASVRPRHRQLIQPPLRLKESKNLVRY